MKSPKGILELGKAIVSELELDERGEILERWLSHYLAELLIKVEAASGSAKAEAEREAVDLILKLWAHRRALPEAADPLAGLREAIAVLGRLAPDANPWGRFRHRAELEELLHSMFVYTTRGILAGVLLTQLKCTRPVTSPELAALEEEEIAIREALEGWQQFFVQSVPVPKIRVSFVDGDGAEVDAQELGGSDDEDTCPDIATQKKNAEESLHSAIEANLERIQTDLATLITRWKALKARKDAPPDSDEDSDLEDDHHP